MREEGGSTSVLPLGAAGLLLLTSSTAVSRFRGGLKDTAEVNVASGAVTAANTWAGCLPVQSHRMGSDVLI